MDNKLIPLFSISGLTILSISSLIYLKTKDIDIIPPKNQSDESNIPSPTQVPKSIEHYLLASQQFFTQALEAQNNKKDAQSITNLLNRSLTFANEAIKIFPNDFRAYLQRGQIYQSLVSSPSPDKNELNQAISDYLTAQKLNSNSAEITKILAGLFAQKGDAQNTLTFLSKTVSLEPTKAQNFYDLARIQQQTGLINNAVITYEQLLSILTDPAQKLQVEAEKVALEKLASQNSNSNTFVSPEPSSNVDEPLIQASLPNTGLIIATPEINATISVKNQTNSNSLSGDATIATGNTNINIQNSNLSSSSQVYVSTISGGKNQTLEVISKTKDSFTVGILTPATENILFKWWIVN